MKHAAQRAGLLDPLGFPRSSHFGTYNYSASPHLDKDEAPTHGWVIKRPNSVSLKPYLVWMEKNDVHFEVKRHEKNFYWSSHRLIVELKEQAHWFWDASKDEHGTTIGSDDIKDEKHKPPTSAFVRDHLEDAQLTRVSVLPKAVASSFHRHMHSWCPLWTIRTAMVYGTNSYSLAPHLVTAWKGRLYTTINKSGWAQTDQYWCAVGLWAQKPHSLIKLLFIMNFGRHTSVHDSRTLTLERYVSTVAKFNSGKMRKKQSVGPVFVLYIRKIWGKLGISQLLTYTLTERRWTERRCLDTKKDTSLKMQWEEDVHIFFPQRISRTKEISQVLNCRLHHNKSLDEQQLQKFKKFKKNQENKGRVGRSVLD